MVHEAPLKRFSQSCGCAPPATLASRPLAQYSSDLCDARRCGACVLRAACELDRNVPNTCGRDCVSSVQMLKQPFPALKRSANQRGAQHGLFEAVSPFTASQHWRRAATREAALPEQWRPTSERRCGSRVAPQRMRHVASVSAVLQSAHRHATPTPRSRSRRARTYIQSPSHGEAARAAAPRLRRRRCRWR